MTATASTIEGVDYKLPAEPLVIIEPAGRWRIIGLKDIWAYRELLYFLTWRDVKVKYKQTALGAAWAILQPLFMMLIFTIFFGRLAGVGSDGVPYPLFALAGLVPWTFFANSVTASSNSLVGSANLITKVYFPRLIVPAAAMLAGLVDFVLAFLLLAGSACNDHSETETSTPTPSANPTPPIPRASQPFKVRDPSHVASSH